MSIDELIEEHERSGELNRVTSDRRAERTMFIGKDVIELLEKEWLPEEQEEGRRCGYLEQQLEAFVEGTLIGVCMTPRRANENATLGILHPPEDGVWDLRSVAPPPGLRVIGMFAKADVFVGLRWAPRSVPWYHRLPLLEFGSRRWRDAILHAKAEWNRLFPGHRHYYVGDNAHDYITARAHRV